MEKANIALAILLLKNVSIEVIKYWLISEGDRSSGLLFFKVKGTQYAFMLIGNDFNIHIPHKCKYHISLILKYRFLSYFDNLDYYPL